VPSNLGSALATDLYQLTMAAGYFHRGMQRHVATCEMFVRRLPLARRFLVALGVADLVKHLEGLRFTEEDLAFLSDLPALRSAMTPDFVAYLRDFRFTGDMWAVREGTIVFENEPLLRVRAPLIEAQLVETFALSLVNHATMIGSKAARVVMAAGGRGVVEFGTRRTHPDAAIDAARAAYSVGFAATSNVAAGKRFGIPVLGTAAHMWTMAHRSEVAAFEGYFHVFPDSTILLIDTYDTPRGALRAAHVCRDKLRGVRLDSGDLDRLSREVRVILDREGAPQARIVASGDLNEHEIAALVTAGAPIDTFGVGTELVCSVDAPSLGGIYKLVELDDGSERRAMAKFSEGKATFAGVHQIYRITDAAGKYDRDVLALEDEGPPTLAGGQLAHALLVPAMVGGKRTSAEPSLDDVRHHVAAGLAALPPILRDLAPRTHEGPRYPVEPSARLRIVTEECRQRFVARG
jgi:nicotinate phosphoribosyltransferase